ncbi:hypothetical protein Hanom_Chr00s000002g01600851 [Helianthus anomalus]
MPPGSEAHGRSEEQGGSESGKVEASGSWMAHNPACDNLPHVPCWSLVQGSRMDSFDNCHKFYTMSLPFRNIFIRRTGIVSGKPDNDFELFKSDCATHYRNKRKEFGLLEFRF